jgi:hypothetical protein
MVKHQYKDPEAKSGDGQQPWYGKEIITGA